MNEDVDLANRYSKWNLDDLVRFATVEASDFRPEALAAMRKELRRRGHPVPPTPIAVPGAAEQPPRGVRYNILAVAGPGSQYSLTGTAPAGFWAGLWHGIISPITLIVSAFSPEVRIYEIHNRGLRYDLGFVVGVASTFGGTGTGSTR